MKRNTFASVFAAPLGCFGLQKIAFPTVFSISLILLLTFSVQAQVSAWGGNFNGQIGDGTTINPRSTPVTLGSPLTADITAFGGGDVHILALRSDGTVLAWGRNEFGERGDGTISVGFCACNPTPGAVTGLTNVVSISADGNHSLAVKSDGTVWAWGRNNFGQLGNNSTSPQTTPVQVGVGVGGFNNIVAVEAGAHHSVALKADGTVWAWGRNEFGQVRGDGTFGGTDLLPVQVLGVANVISITAGQFHTIVSRDDGKVFGWGYNTSGQIGNGTISGGCGCLPNVTESSIIGVAKVSAGWDHTVALKQDGTVWVWGRNNEGEVGNGTLSTAVPTPTQTSTLTGIADVRSSGFHTIARRKDGTLFSWGFNGQGQVTANGTTSSDEELAVSVPVGVSNAVFAVGYTSSYVSAPNIPTSTGAGIFIPGENFALTFANVTTAGNTTAQTIDPAAQPLTVPTGFQLQNNAVGYNISTTAAFTGSVNVCLTAPSVQNQILFNSLILYHGEGSNWVDRTTSRDYRKRQVCGTVSTLSPFALGRPNVVTAAGVMVSGRVTTAEGKAIRGALVTMTDAQGNTRTSITGLTGYYRFADVTVGATYIFSVSAKRYSFSQQTQVRNILSETDDIDFTADGYKSYLK